jgi:acyl carrier protein
MPDDLTEKVITTLAAVKHIPREQIKPESSLAELGFDSLDTISMLFELETAFQVSIPDESARSIRYVHEIVDGIRTLQAAGPPQPAAPGAPAGPESAH